MKEWKKSIIRVKRRQIVREVVLQARSYHQEVAEARRHSAADVGETTRGFLEALVAAGRSEQQARNADVHALASSDEDA